MAAMVPALSDAGILDKILSLHYETVPSIIDTTASGLRMWRGCRYQPTVRFDRRPLSGVDLVGTWDQLPELVTTRYQVAVWDPPHQTNGGKNALGGRWADAYGTEASGPDLRTVSISHLYPGFLQAVRSVLEPSSGLLLAKIADQTHNGLQQLQAVDFVIACRAAGWSVCEMIPKMRRPGPRDPKWRRQYHVRKAWSYWICAHPGPRCPAAGVDLVRVCPGCGEAFHPRRKDMRVCRSAACRKRVQRGRDVLFQEHAAEKRNKTRDAA